MTTNQSLTIDHTGGFVTPSSNCWPYWQPLQHVPYPVYVTAPALAPCDHCYCKDDTDDHLRCCKCTDRKHGRYIEVKRFMHPMADPAKPAPPAP